MNLGTLEKVKIRDVWPGEARDFTPWLATAANLDLLGKAIGMDLELESTEVAVGSYRLDILARASGTNEAVVIENQFGATDHSHLGQLLTYAAGVSNENGPGARTIVWIAEDFCEPHRSALDWLNSISEAGIGFFGVQIELWRIGSSLPAPRFTIISKPNDWQKAVTKQTSATQSDDLYLSFWSSFVEFAREAGTSLRFPSPWGRQWLPVTIGRSNFIVSLVVTRRNDIRCELYMSGPKAKKAFRLLLEDEKQLFEELGPNLRFEELPTRMASRIVQSRSGDITEREQWPDIQEWLKNRGEAFQIAFTNRVKKLDLEESDTNESSEI